MLSGMVKISSCNGAKLLISLQQSCNFANKIS